MNDFSWLASLAVLLVRPGMLVIATPLLGAVQAPVPVRVGITLLLAIVLAPVVAVPVNLTIFGLAIVILREVAIGLALSLAIRVLVAGAEFAGHFTGYQIGLSIGSLIDPQTGVRNNIVALLYGNLAVLALFATNGHHNLLRALVDSYAALPIGAGGGVSPALADSVARMIGLIFVIGVRLSAPVIVVLLLVELSLGLLARIAPALNVMMAGAPIRLAVGLLIVAGTVSVIPTLMSRYAPAALDLAASTARAFR